MPDFDRQKPQLNIPQSLDADTLEQTINHRFAHCPALICHHIGTSILGRKLHRLTMGNGQNSVVFVGGISGTDQTTTAVLLHFVREFNELYSRTGQIFGQNLRCLAELRRIELIPMLNPDGIGYSLHGIAEDHLLRARLLGMNRGSDDFTQWHANARGVDLRCNFSSSAASFSARKQKALSGEYPSGGPFGWCGEAPESEPESSALSRFLRTGIHIGMLVVLSVGEENAICCPASANQHTIALAQRLSTLCGFSLRTSATNIFLCDWAMTELNLPAVEIVCTRTADPFSLYTALRELLFLSPTLLCR